MVPDRVSRTLVPTLFCWLPPMMALSGRYWKIVVAAGLLGQQGRAGSELDASGLLRDKVRISPRISPGARPALQTRVECFQGDRAQ